MDSIKKRSTVLIDGKIPLYNMITMQASNIAYFLLALYMASKHLPGSELVFFVFIVSLVHHSSAYNTAWFWFDIVVACSVTILLACMYVPLADFTNPLFLTGLSISFVAFFLFVTSGTKYESKKFEYYHSLWHVLTALSFFLILKSLNK